VDERAVTIDKPIIHYIEAIAGLYIPLEIDIEAEQPDERDHCLHRHIRCNTVDKQAARYLASAARALLLKRL
jgi:hypothetical protein